MKIIYLKEYIKKIDKERVNNILDELVYEGFLESDSKGIKAIILEECGFNLSESYIKTYIKKRTKTYVSVPSKIIKIIQYKDKKVK